MAGISSHFLLSPAPALSLYSRSHSCSRPAAAVGGVLRRPVQVRHHRITSCCSSPEDDTEEEECTTSKSAATTSGKAAAQAIPSRRKCLACLCAVTLFTASGPTLYTPNGLAADMQKAVCRNCGGGGAIICDMCGGTGNGRPSTEREPKIYMSSRNARIAMGGGSWSAQFVLEQACRTTRGFSVDRTQRSCSTRCTTASYCPTLRVLLHSSKKITDHRPAAAASAYRTMYIQFFR